MAIEELDTSQLLSSDLPKESKTPKWVYAANVSRGLWDHLERNHNLPGLSKQSVANNKKVWLMVHARMHGMHNGILGVDHDELY